jgi:hypothetical protein
MNKGIFRKVLPHLIAVAVFLIVALIYCHPAVEGKVLAQQDIIQWKGAIKESQEYKATHGQYPLWTNSLFSGMPAFQIGYSGNNVLPWIANSVFSLYLPVPIAFFFLAALAFYFLSQVLRVNPFIGIFGALSFAYATYNPVIIWAGHETKMFSICYMPAVLGSILLIFDHRKYWVGAALTALFTAILVAMNHPQIAYYLFLSLGIMTVFYIVRWIRQKDFRHMAFALGLTLAAGAVGLLTNAVHLLSTYEYQAETIRGGHSDLVTPQAGDAEHGLSKNYAFAYSLSISEPFVLMVPRMFGGSNDHLEVAEAKSKAITALRTLPQEAQQFFFQNLGFLFGESDEGELFAKTYWGGIGGTSGPPYSGAIVCFLAIMAMFVLDNRHKWWMMTAILLAVVMSWGEYFEDVNLLFYKYLPLYNKFRAPSMIMVIPQLLLPALAVMGLHKISFYDEKAEKALLWPRIKKGLVANGVVLGILFLLYMSFDFLSKNDQLLMQQINESRQPQLTEIVNTFYQGLKEDRKSLMLGDIFRSLGFMAAAFVVVYMLYRRKMAPVLGFSIIALLSFIDLVVIDSIYLNKTDYKDPIGAVGEVPLSQADNILQADKSFYRVYNRSQITENLTSYHYNSVGGYHTARLRIYNDLIDSQIAKGNPAVMNMLNAKYIIEKDMRTGATTSATPNPGALGNVWFVRNIQTVPGPKEEMKALDNLNPGETAVMQQSFRNSLGNLPSTFPAAGTIQLVNNNNDVITYRSSSAANEFAVFSEVYYAAGWKAFIDGKEAPIVKVNYVLRGLSVPAGNHEIIFRFEPQGYMTGRTLTTIFSIILGLMLAAGIFLEWRERRRTAVAK